MNLDIIEMFQTYAVFFATSSPSPVRLGSSSNACKAHRYRRSPELCLSHESLKYRRLHSLPEYRCRQFFHQNIRHNSIFSIFIRKFFTRVCSHRRPFPVMSSWKQDCGCECAPFVYFKLPSGFCQTLRLISAKIIYHIPAGADHDDITLSHLRFS